ncbi:DUF6302 family protein [Streptomyces uncialis]|uniref:DUF6302 family protein n=1 Tax=Streptomyces uncialis TaxID=1048205 RepID=UPI0036590662
MNTTAPASASASTEPRPGHAPPVTGTLLPGPVRVTLFGLAHGLHARQIDAERPPGDRVTDHLPLLREVFGVDTLPELVDAAYLTGVLPPPPPDPEPADLTDQAETAVLLTVQGRPTRTVARRIGLTPDDTRALMVQVMRRLGAGTPAHLVTRARQLAVLHWIPGDGPVPMGRVRRELRTLRVRLQDPSLTDRAVVLRTGDHTNPLMARPAVPVGGSRQAGFLPVAAGAVPGIRRQLDARPQEFPRLGAHPSRTDRTAALLTWGTGLPTRDPRATARLLGYHTAGATAFHGARRTPRPAPGRQAGGPV